MTASVVAAQPDCRAASILRLRRIREQRGRGVDLGTFLHASAARLERRCEHAVSGSTFREMPSDAGRLSWCGGIPARAGAKSGAARYSRPWMIHAAALTCTAI